MMMRSDPCLFSNDDLRKENLLTSPCFCCAIIRFLCLGMPKNKYIELNYCVCQRSGFVQTQQERKMIRTTAYIA